MCRASCVASTESERTNEKAHTKESKCRGDAISSPSPSANEMMLEPTNLSTVHPTSERVVRRDLGQ